MMAYEDMRPGLEVRARLYGGKMARATIERVHLCWTTISTGSITLGSLRSDDTLPITQDCKYGSAARPRPCIHVRYRNNHRDTMEGWAINSLNAVIELAKLAETP